MTLPQLLHIARKADNQAEVAEILKHIQSENDYAEHYGRELPYPEFK